MKKEAKENLHYQREFFDQSYSARAVYGRLWKHVKRYRVRLIIGLVCGMLTAGTLIPMFQLIQPTLDRVGSTHAPSTTVQEACAQVPTQVAPASRAKISQTKKKSQALLKQYNQVKAVAAQLGIHLQDAGDELGAPLVFAICVVLPLLAFLRLGLVFLNHYCLAWAGMRVVADLRLEILEHIQKQSMQFFGRIDVGQLMSRATADPQQVRLIIQNVLQELAEAPFEIIASVGYIIWFAISNEMMPTLSLLFIGFPLFIVPVVTLSRRIHKWAKKALKRFSVVGSRIHEILTCVRVVKAYDTAAYENRRYEGVVRDLLKATLRTLRLGLLVGPAVETIGILLICGFVVWCFIQHIALSNVVPMLAPLLIIYKPLKQLSKIQVQIEQGRAALARIYSILDVKMELPLAEHPLAKKTFDQVVQFEHVSFRYDTADHDAVKDATFELKRGAVVAVVGGTGSGKSTLSGLLSRFYDPREGRVTMDGIDLRALEPRDLRRLIGSVMQETILFNDTIEENIRYGTPEALHEDVVRAAKLANAHDFIMSQPEGYQRLVGEKGFALSGGERQRIAIARAILRNPPILILDEATSALDTVTEKLVQDAIDKLMKDRTTFAIAHRLSTIRHADLILVMENGVIVERGTHEELFAAGGVYHKLCEMQRTN